jgi:hypothetical protein
LHWGSVGEMGGGAEGACAAGAGRW